MGNVNVCPFAVENDMVACDVLSVTLAGRHIGKAVNGEDHRTRAGSDDRAAVDQVSPWGLPA